ncbi:MAG: CLH domain-containing protein [Candidatus Thiodiazotropha taylori]|nr:CLH domain-containing protein [Candidatus Thiodiazotropha taylori]MCG8051928.1 CLH domain-containing protein [Candidatus Thiodiazotropha taylori]MCW4306096.1 CLH domain-containing protein [Candidatus Thiodiazotropha taylori]MCW4313750.1 CLH domain-containing protein [Candidatus Thiodiazotropha taylori]
MKMWGGIKEKIQEMNANRRATAIHQGQATRKARYGTGAIPYKLPDGVTMSNQEIRADYFDDYLIQENEGPLPLWEKNDPLIRGGLPDHFYHNLSVNPGIFVGDTIKTIDRSAKAVEQGLGKARSPRERSRLVDGKRREAMDNIKWHREARRYLIVKRFETKKKMIKNGDTQFQEAIKKSRNFKGGFHWGSLESQITYRLGKIGSQKIDIENEIAKVRERPEVQQYEAVGPELYQKLVERDRSSSITGNYLEEIVAKQMERDALQTEYDELTKVSEQIKQYKTKYVAEQLEYNKKNPMRIVDENRKMQRQVEKASKLLNQYDLFSARNELFLRIETIDRGTDTLVDAMDSRLQKALRETTDYGFWMGDIRQRPETKKRGQDEAELMYLKDVMLEGARSEMPRIRREGVIESGNDLFIPPPPKGGLQGQDETYLSSAENRAIDQESDLYHGASTQGATGGMGGFLNLGYTDDSFIPKGDRAGQVDYLTPVDIAPIDYLTPVDIAPVDYLTPMHLRRDETSTPKGDGAGEGATGGAGFINPGFEDESFGSFVTGEAQRLSELIEADRETQEAWRQSDGRRSTGSSILSNDSAIAEEGKKPLLAKRKK